MPRRDQSRSKLTVPPPRPTHPDLSPGQLEQACQISQATHGSDRATSLLVNSPLTKSLLRAINPLHNVALRRFGPDMLCGKRPIQDFVNGLLRAV